ncbi:MAG: ATP-binding cassette domain-containing protein [Bacilli bacterium]|nr:ATP-binding cassette domain-containing protein [Bacilli bacterium]
MSYIVVDGISKTFKVSKRSSGMKAALKSFFKRNYEYIDAVKDISFSIEKGEIVGYIGPNGAGKSTTIKMLSGILLPTAGNIRVNGFNPFKDRKKYVSNIGVVFGQRSQLAWDIPAEDTFDLLRDIYKLDDKKYQKNKEELIKLLNIEEIIKKPVRSLSLGERMRCEICASLLHNPKILFLDEPTIGLDAQSKKIVRDFIIKINKEKKVTVILTTHDMMDIDALAKRIILIGKGKILYDGSLNKLKNEYGSYKKISIKTNDTIKEINLKGIISKKKIDGGYNLIIDSNIISVSKIVNHLSKYHINDLDIDNEQIDDIILKLYQDYKI